MQVPPEDIRKEPLIQKKWSFKSRGLTHYPDGLLVTGPNSFIGAHVVKEALKEWGGPVHLLLRASSPAEAVTKMKLAFAKWQLGAFPETKAEIHLGDILLPRMGLSSSEYNQLKSSTGHIVHLAITPVYQLPYQHFKRVWIPELERMILFCTDKDHPKNLHYLSTVFTHLFTTEDDFMSLNSNVWLSGYTGFKWVAVKALENAFSQDLRGCIYDLPQVMGSEDIGLCPWYSPIMRLLEIFLKTTSYCRFNIPIFPVDILARLIILNCLHGCSGEGSSFIRPMLNESLDATTFTSIMEGILKMRETDTETLRKSLHDRMRVDLLLPENFCDLLQKINNLPVSFPDKFPASELPSTSAVAKSNLGRVRSYDNSYVSPNY